MWSSDRREEFVEFRRLVQNAVDLDKGSGVLKRLSTIVALGTRLSTWDVDGERKSFVEFLADLAREQQAVGVGGLRWYRWDTDIGEFLACAESVEQARATIMSSVSEEDAVRDDLAMAIAGEPEDATQTPRAVLAWHNG